MALAENLKEARNNKKITQEELATMLGKSKNVISNWERGDNKPDADTLFALCDILSVDANYLLGWSENSDVSLSIKEQKHIKKYRVLEPQGKEMVDMVLDKELEFMQQRRTKAIEQKKPTEFVMLEPPKVIPSYQSIASASAGTGQYVFDDLVPNLIEVDTDCKADFVIDVRGDSMMPTYYDGDGLLVKKQDAIPLGEIGIFMIDGEAYVKECGGDRLISHNKKYEDILLKEHQDIRCIGKVLGRLE